MKHTQRVIILLIIGIFLSVVFMSCSRDAAAPETRLNWAWRRHFKNMEVGNLAMAWNGSRMVFSVTEKAAGSPKGDVIIGADNTSAVLKDWRAGGKVGRLSLSGDGKRLLTELEDGGLLFYDDWKSGKKPAKIKSSSPGALMSPEGDFIAISAKKTSRDQPNIEVVSGSGKQLWSYHDFAGDSLKTLFPFLKNKKQMVFASSSGAVHLLDEGKLVWKAAAQGTPLALSSSFLEGGLLAIAGNGDENNIRFFYNRKGSITGSAGFKGKITSLSCSDIGNACAALGKSGNRQRLAVYAPDGKELWKYTLKALPGYDSSVAIAAHGTIVIAGFEEAGEWSLRAWDIKGRPLWTAPIEGGLADFKVSWNGKRIAALTRDGRVAFFEIK